MRHWLLFVPCVIAVTLLQTAAAQDPPAEKPAPPAAKPASETPATPATHEVQATPFEITVKQDGVFESSRMAEIAIRPQNTLTLTVERAVDHGRSVRKGHTLVWLDTSAIDKQIQSAEHDLQISQLSLRVSEAEVEEAEKLFGLDMQAAVRSNKIAEEDLDYFLRITRPSTEKSAKFSLESARHSLEYAQEELDQLRKMYEADDLTEESEELVLKRARRSVESAEYYLESAETRYNRTLDQDLPRQVVDLRDAAQRQQLGLQKSKVALPISLKKRQLELEKAKRQHQKSVEDLAKLKRDREALKVTAPIDGTVYYGQCTRGKWSDPARYQEKLTPGGSLTPKQPFLTVVAMRPLLVRLDVPEKELQHVRRGMAATVRPVALPDLALAAKVHSIGQIPIAGNAFDCVLRIETEKLHAQLVPGMNCKVEFHVYRNEKAITVPKSAVFEEEDGSGKTYVYVKTAEGETVKRPVVVGRRDAEKAEIRRGLKTGEKILLEKPDAK
jgi:RND family efflux transporter MFP subunit